MYEKEGIVVHEDEPKAEFSLYHHPKMVEDNQDEFPSVARILDALLRRVDPTNPVLEAYLTTINPLIETRVLLSKFVAGPSNKSKGSKKGVKASPSKPSPKPVEKVVIVSLNKVAKKVVQTVVEELSIPAKEVMPSKNGVLKRSNKMAHRPLHPPERPSVKEENFKITRNPQINSKGVVICEIPTPVSPASKKQRALDMAKCVSKNKKKVVKDPMYEVVPESNFDESGNSQSPPRDIDMGFPSPTRDSPIKSNVEET